ncbi:DNA helicase [Planctomycetales bacterium]|nr:DNA helicase [Planctomycetales bacterium]GHT04853.1 DNA helicase [Planctomycetales bacterium]
MSAPLNAAQREAVAVPSGALLLLAGAGTGKTHTVIARIAALLEHTPPENILAVTFTNKAAGELKARLRQTLSRRQTADRLLACTFHSLGLQIIRRDAAAVGLEKNFTIAGTGEQLALVRQAARHVNTLARLSPPDLLTRLSRLKGAALSPAEFSRQAFSESDAALAAVYRKYQERLRLRGVVDFDDLLLLAYQLLTQNAAVRDYWTTRFRQIIVDEFQDTSELQYRLVKTLAQKWGNVCVVGDDDQSIYSWRGAAPQHLLNFARDWDDAKIIFLRENYRSTNAILKVANAVIANNQQRHAKELFSSRDGGAPRLWECADPESEAKQIAGEIRDRLAAGKNVAADFAIIVRANALTTPIVQQLAAEKIPFTVIGGVSFFDHKEVLDVLAFLTLAVNPADDGALRRIINTPARGIGDAAQKNLIAAAAQKNRPLTALLSAADADLSPAAAKSCRDFAAQIARWQKTVRENPRAVVEQILTDTAYQDEVEHLYDTPLTRAARMETAREVGSDLARFLDSGGDAAGYLAETALARTRREAPDKKADAGVKVITMHSAKGLEFPVVYVAGVEENILPHRRSVAEDDDDEENSGGIDEERRLFYVAITRARAELTLSYCRRRGGRGDSGKMKAQLPSRFLGEIPPTLLTPQSCLPTDAERAAIFAAMREKLAQ